MALVDALMSLSFSFQAPYTVLRRSPLFLSTSSSVGSNISTFSQRALRCFYSTRSTRRRNRVFGWDVGHLSERGHIISASTTPTFSQNEVATVGVSSSSISLSGTSSMGSSSSSSSVLLPDDSGPLMSSSVFPGNGEESRSLDAPMGRAAGSLSSVSPPQHDNPLVGPPSLLRNLQVKEQHIVRMLGYREPITITRLSFDPDIYLVRQFVGSSAELESLMRRAQEQGMKPAQTRNSEENTVRKDSHLTWLPCSSSKQEPTASFKVPETMMNLAKFLFVHEDLRFACDENEYLQAEDLQVAKYEAKGRFDFHHDGYNRFLTVLTYLNGVGGTFFPFAQTERNECHTTESTRDSNLDQKGGEAEEDEEKNWLALARIKIPGRDGLLIVGSQEGVLPYIQSQDNILGMPENERIVRIEAGDAVVFYNNQYEKLCGTGGGLLGTRNLRAIHSSLLVPQEKWISTNWFRSDVLTGPFAWLYQQRLLGER